MRGAALAALAAAVLLATPAAAWQEGAGYLELADRLDRPRDGYCLDLPGSGEWVDFSMPLNVHNCKRPGLFADEAVTFAAPGPIRFPAYGGCVTAVGLNGRSLPGAPVMLRPCADDPDAPASPFVAASLQRFERTGEGRIALAGTGLCLTAGTESAATFSPSHRWRALTLERCEAAPPERSVWRPFTPAGG